MYTYTHIYLLLAKLLLLPVISGLLLLLLCLLLLLLYFKVNIQVCTGMSEFESCIYIYMCIHVYIYTCCLTYTYMNVRQIFKVCRGITEFQLTRIHILERTSATFYKYADTQTLFLQIRRYADTGVFYQTHRHTNIMCNNTHILAYLFAGCT